MRIIIEAIFLSLCLEMCLNTSLKTNNINK